jgi:hypothetical protein
MRYDAVNRHAYYLLIVWIISDLERVGAHDQSSALAHDTGNRSGTVAADEGTGTRPPVSG